MNIDPDREEWLIEYQRNLTITAASLFCGGALLVHLLATLGDNMVAGHILGLLLAIMGLTFVALIPFSAFLTRREIRRAEKHEQRDTED